MKEPEWSINIEHMTYSDTYPENPGGRAYGVKCQRNRGDRSSHSGPRDSEAEVLELIRHYIEENRDREDYILGRRVSMTLRNTSLRNDTDLDVSLAALFGEPEQLSLLEATA